MAGSPCTPRLAPTASPKASKGNDGKPTFPGGSAVRSLCGQSEDQ
jgi:hypothetical protein